MRRVSFQTDCRWLQTCFVEDWKTYWRCYLVGLRASVENFELQNFLLVRIDVITRKEGQGIFYFAIYKRADLSSSLIILSFRKFNIRTRGSEEEIKF